ncbi:hypothetical protein ACT009_14785 [Sphingomonas sp. Tas61C01]|uniref:hypothetical protein n=1 Tax=Sphingomonas sp. Tas61C01 TaxID=3458297 RepID=UPI00403ECF82
MAAPEADTAPQAEPAVQPEDQAQDIVVLSRLPRCRLLPRDVADTIPTGGRSGPQVIRPDWKTGELDLFPEDYPITGKSFWQRVGSPIGSYRFRSPAGGDLLCIGSNGGNAFGYAQLRQAIDARPYRGKVVRFTALVATWKAASVTFWLASGESQYSEGKREKLGKSVIAGGDSHERPIHGNQTWLPISYVIGPIPACATQISYGVTLEGGGDVWVYKPAFESVPREQLSASMRNRPAADRACRKRRIFSG